VQTVESDNDFRTNHTTMVDAVCTVGGGCFVSGVKLGCIDSGFIPDTAADVRSAHVAVCDDVGVYAHNACAAFVVRPGDSLCGVL